VILGFVKDFRIEIKVSKIAHIAKISNAKYDLNVFIHNFRIHDCISIFQFITGKHLQFSSYLMSGRTILTQQYLYHAYLPNQRSTGGSGPPSILQILYDVDNIRFLFDFTDFADLFQQLELYGRHFLG
jgi:hypothetical protein